MMHDDPGISAELVFRQEDSLRDAAAKMRSAFAAAGLATPDVDARYLMQGVLQISATELIREPQRPVGAAASQLSAAAARRLTHEPVSRILGERTFYGRSFEITADVLDPRADTEVLVEAVLSLLEEQELRNKPLKIADIGSGSGAIIVSLLCELPQARGIASDVSATAIEVTRRNAVRHGVADRLSVFHGRGLESSGPAVDLVVSNPPYIPTADVLKLDRDVRDFDPRLALDGGPDGLDVYREISIYINELCPLAGLAVEVGAGQAEAVASIFAAAAFARHPHAARFHRDLGGHVRCVTFQMEN